MDRLNRMLQAAQGMGMGSAAPGGVSYSMLRPQDILVFTLASWLYLHPAAENH